MFFPGDDIQNPAQADTQAGLLQTFADCCLSRILPSVDKPSGQRPEAAKRFASTAYQKDSSILLDQHRGRNLRVNKMDPFTLWANCSHFAIEFFMIHFCAATRTVIKFIVCHPVNYDTS